MSDIFREVDEALQREKAAKFWKQYGPLLVGGALLLVIATGAGTAWRTWNESSNRAETGRLIAAMESQDMAPALEKFAASADGGQRAVALMNAAARYATEKNFAKAATSYKQVADDKNAPQDLRDLSAILSAQSLQHTDEKQDYAAIIETLKPAASRKEGAFMLQAKLESALLYGDGLKDYASALKMLEGFDAAGIPASLQEKANALTHVYKYESQTAQ